MPFTHKIFDSFLKECESQIEKTDKRKTVIIDKGVLRIGRQRISNYFRIYRPPIVFVLVVVHLLYKSNRNKLKTYYLI